MRRQVRFVAALLATALTVACGSGPTSPSGTGGPAADLPSVPVMGSARLSASQLVAWFNRRQPQPAGIYGATEPVEALASYFIDEGVREGVAGFGPKKVFSASLAGDSSPLMSSEAAVFGCGWFKPEWWNWQTRTFEGRVAQAVRVQVPPPAPPLVEGHGQNGVPALPPRPWFASAGENPASAWAPEPCRCYLRPSSSSTPLIRSGHTVVASA